MTNVVRLKPCTDVAAMLRQIADRVEAAEFGDPDGVHCTVIIGRDVWGLGTYDDGDAASKVVFDCQLATAKLMKAALATEAA